LEVHSQKELIAEFPKNDFQTTNRKKGKRQTTLHLQLNWMYTISTEKTNHQIQPNL